MKPHLLATAALIASASPLLADGMTPAPRMPAVQPAVVPTMQITDWSGPYAGLTFGMTGGDMSTTPPSPGNDLNDGTAIGGILGYNYQNGALVYGGELGLHSFNDTYVVPGVGNDDTIDTAVDLRGRVGYAVGRSLIYGAAGYSWADMSINGGADGASLTGPSLGIGVDYMVTDNVFLGLDYTRRFLEGDNDLNTFSIDSNVDTVSLRAGFRF
ncbi:outer membrane protein [Nioella nitratireducens]|uniref:outer membrane protein n=1 Tax=Nioella nitratireducens TaxID=1287720 RepID=UPI0008FD4A1B|nr:porin family protein [Nioella nitratireducens]